MVLCQTKVPITQHTVHSTLAQGICKSIFIHWMYCTFCHLLQEPGLSTRDVVWLPHIATLFLMSYTKILLTVTNALSMSRLPCNDSILTVWIVDGNIEYACVHVQTMKSDEHILVCCIWWKHGLLLGLSSALRRAMWILSQATLCQSPTTDPLYLWAHSCHLLPPARGRLCPTKALVQTVRTKVNNCELW